MNSSHLRAPHASGAPAPQHEAPNAALLIDFDNVTMGMRSDLSKELKNLLNSDIIKGKVTVQRAYADWRRYPQYIVPLSENSVDLIFAPAYGSSKKNATDIRMAIDAIELVFIRPEIGTFILLTGDSDFSSLVLKLKEYGKYVIGVGIQESSSDILVQNCDEYYSYTSIAGLRKTTEATLKPMDPWVLVERAVEKMVSRGDVMRSDRLKQVMIELDPTFDEGNYGFSKFSRFLSEAAGRGLVKLKKLENGQYEVQPSGSRGFPQPKREPKQRGRSEDVRKSGDRSRKRGPPGKGEVAKSEPDLPDQTESVGEPEPTPEAKEGDPLGAAYDLLRGAMASFPGEGSNPVRDSDLKRKMLEVRPDFDEGALGFGKFSKFLRQAHDHEVIELGKRDEGSYQVLLPAGDAPRGEAEAVGQTLGPPEADLAAEAPASTTVESQERSLDPGSVLVPMEPGGPSGAPKIGVRHRRGERGARRASEDAPPPFLEGQVVGSAGSGAASAGSAGVGGRKDPTRSPRTRRGKKGKAAASDVAAASAPSMEMVDAAALGLPTGDRAMIRYLANSYKGVGQKTAESLVAEFGQGLYAVLQQEPERIGTLIPAGRAEKLLDAWRADVDRRRQKLEEKGVDTEQDRSDEPSPSRRRTRARGRSRSS